MREVELQMTSPDQHSGLGSAGACGRAGPGGRQLGCCWQLQLMIQLLRICSYLTWTLLEVGECGTHGTGAQLQLLTGSEGP